MKQKVSGSDPGIPHLQVGEDVNSEDKISDDFLGGGGGSWAAEFSPEYIVALALAVAQVEGGFRARGYGASTADTISTYLFDRSTATAVRDLRREVDAIFDQCHDKAVDVVIPAVLADLADETSDFAVNLHTLLRAESVGSRHFGLMAATVRVYERLLGQTTPKGEPQAPKEWLGGEGEKVTLTGVITTAMTVDGYAYNTTQRMMVVTGESAVVKFYTSAKWAYEAGQGDTVGVTGTVKRHSTYRDTKQTELSRVKRVDA